MFSSRKSSAPVSGGNPTLGTKSLRFRSSASAYLNRTPSSATNRQTWTWSAWVKRGLLGTSQYTLFSGGTTNTDTGWLGIYFSGDNFYVTGWVTAFLGSTQVFRDPSAWYHIVVVLDTTQSTATNRIKVYVNGSQITAFSTDNRSSITQNSNLGINQSASHTIGSQSLGGANYLDGYLTDINFIDGQALTPTSFGSFSGTGGVWQPIVYTGTFGTNGFYLPFSNATSTTTLGYDQSGNSNNWTANNISLTAGATYDSMNDIPQLTSATASNYAVLNPNNVSSTVTVSNGNLNFSYATTGAVSIYSTIGVSSGKWYTEFTWSAINSITAVVGITLQGYDLPTNYVGGTAFSYGYVFNGNKINNGSSSAYGASYSNGDVIGVAFDASAGTLTFYKNGTSQGTAYTGIPSGTYFIGISPGGATTSSASANFGQQGFAYTPPSGYVALNTYNLSTPTIAQGNLYMDATLYTGNNGTQSITNAGAFQPDFLWIKSRSGAFNHNIWDAVRTRAKFLYSNLTNAEATSAAGVDLISFNSNGFTLGQDSSANSNSSGGPTYVAWQWKANGSGSSNTNGSITSTVSASTTAGFSIVTYTGSGTAGTIGHGLGIAPSMIIVKSRSATGDWPVYHSSIGNGSYVLLDTIAISATSSTIWNATSPTSSVFSVGINTLSNNVTTTYVAYCFAPIAGFSAFGSYAGNASGATGSQFIYTGFQPKFVLVKVYGPTGGGGAWTLFDSTRSPYNLGAVRLQPQSSAVEGSTSPEGINFLSNGFQLVGDFNFGDTNGTGYNYIYMAFASNPFKYSNAF
jgi:hypothetical protein